MIMTTTYFTAASGDDIAAALDTPPAGPEVLTSAIAPDGDAFTALLKLVLGTEDVLTAATSRVVRLSPSFVSEIANRDAAEFAELAGPWQRSGTIGDTAGMDVTDYLIELQHLCRNAIAAGRAVYAVESI